MIKIYNSKIKKYRKELTELIKKNRFVSYSRAVVFILLIIVLYFSADINSALLSFLVIVLISVFFILVKKNLKLKKAIRKVKFFIKINEEEIKAQKGDFSIFNDGKEYVNFDHPFSYDLDVFGDGSLFQFLNRTSTISGKNNLAKSISEINENSSIIKQRQLAILELAEMIDWRQNFIASSLTESSRQLKNADTKQDTVELKLVKWANEKVDFINKNIWTYLLYALPTLTFVLFFLSVLGLLPYSFVGLSAIINLSIIGFFTKKINLEQAKLGKSISSLKKIKELIRIVEFSEFKTEYLKKLKNILANNGAFSKIEKLNKTLSAFDIRLNIIAGVLLNAILLWDLQILRRLETQKRQIKNEIKTWFGTIGEFDALISFANFNYNHPNYAVPQITDSDFVMDVLEGGHPLISEDKVVTNSFKVVGLQNISIITGANMAGKSTFLRMLGINMILASSGTCVCATEMVYSPIQIFTSVRTNDSLQKNESYFYAELMRLKKIVDTLKAGKKLFVIIDEMLRGTNSKDKHRGSYELIKQLINFKAVGLLATHDVQLGKLAEEYPNNISNKRFEVEIINDKVIFDYKLKDGISQNLNASFLMKKYGII